MHLATNLAGKDVLGGAVSGVHVEQVHLAGLQCRVVSKAWLPPHVPSVQYHLQSQSLGLVAVPKQRTTMCCTGKLA